MFREFSNEINKNIYRYKLQTVSIDFQILWDTGIVFYLWEFNGR